VTKLNDPLPLGVSLFGFSLSADGATVIYDGAQTTPGVRELYRVASTGGTVTRISGPMVMGGNVLFSPLISADGGTVVYLADQDTDGVIELYSVAAQGGAVVKLNAPLVTNGDVNSRFRISADSSAVVYLADQDVDGITELYSVPIDGGPVTKLNSPLPDGESVEVFDLSDDSTTATYTTVLNSDPIFKAQTAKGDGNNHTTGLFSVPISGGDARRLSRDFSAGTGNITSQISPDSSIVVYLADFDVPGVFELHGVPINGGTIVKLSAELVSGGNVQDFQFSPDSRRIIYQADQDTDQVVELFSLTRGGLGRADALFLDGFEQVPE